jgi:hypothetical protein
MSNLPQIDPAKLAQKLATKNAEQSYQLVQLEVLAEALRDERDEALQKLEEALAAKTSATVIE